MSALTTSSTSAPPGQPEPTRPPEPQPRRTHRQERFAADVIEGVTRAVETLQARIALMGNGPRIHQTLVESLAEAVEGCDRAALLLKDEHGLHCLNGSDPTARQVLERDVSLGRGAAVLAAGNGRLQADHDTRLDWDDTTADPLLDPLRTSLRDSDSAGGAPPGKVVARASMACQVQAAGVSTLAVVLYTQDPAGFGTVARAQLKSLQPVLALVVALASARQEGEQLTRELAGALGVGKAVGLLMTSRRLDADEALAAISAGGRRRGLTLTRTAAAIVEEYEATAARR